MGAFTNTPWYIKGDIPDIRAVMLVSSDDKPIATVIYGRNLKETRERAEFIIHAVNCHDELVEALEALADEQALFAPQLPPIYAQRVARARAVLAKVKALR